MGVLCKDVQDEHGAVNNLEFSAFGNGPTLARGQSLIKDEQISADLQTAHNDFVKLPPSEHIMRVALIALLNDAVDGYHTAGRGQFREFLQRFFGNRLAPGSDADEDGALTLIPDRICLLRPDKFIFQGLDEAEEIHFQLIDGEAVLHVPLLALRIVRQKRRNAGIIGQAIGPDTDSHHDIEPEVGQVGHIVGGKGLTAQVCVYVTQTTQTIRCYTRAPKVGRKMLL